MNTNLMHPDDVADMMGDGYRNEHQRQHAASGIAFRASQDSNPDHDRIARLLAAGKHVAVRYTPAYCRSTDAYIGEVRSLFCYADTHEAVLSDIKYRFRDGLDANDEDRLEILPALPAPAPAPYGEPGGIDDGVPF